MQCAHAEEEGRKREKGVWKLSLVRREDKKTEEQWENRCFTMLSLSVEEEKKRGRSVVRQEDEERLLYHVLFTYGTSLDDARTPFFIG